MSVVYSNLLTAESCRNHRSVYIAPIESTGKPLHVPLVNGGQAFWLDSRTIAHVVPNEQAKIQDLYAISVSFETESAVTVSNLPKNVSAFPTISSANFLYIAKTG